MKKLTHFFIFTISLTFILPSCDPEFLVDQDTCFFLGTCAKGEQLTWHVGTATCWCYCEFNDPESEGCGNRCQFKKSDCQGTVEVNDFDGLNQCACKCPDGWKNPPNCDIIQGTWAVDWFDMWANPSFPFRLGNNQGTSTKDYFPLNEGNIWKYAAFDSSGMNVISSFAYGIVDTFALDTLDTIRIYDFNYFFFDSNDQVFDTLVGMMLYEDPADSSQVYNFSNNSSPFISHHFNYGDTLFSDGPDYTIADSIGSVSVAAGTFENCIWLRNQDSSGQVLAPDVGIIQMLAENLRVLELSNYFIHCPFHIEIDTFGASSCASNDGKIDLLPFGDISNLSYQWDGPTAVGNVKTAENLSAGYYTVTVTNGDCSNVFDSIPVAGCSSLPVELLYFSAKDFDQHVLLNWSTATEVNNDYFQLEHSIDGKKFIPVTRLTGAGTSFRKTDYQFLHKSPVKGVNFYRLKQVDFGGLYEYSDIVSANLDDIQFSFYPNPATDKITLISNHESFIIQLRKMDGSIVLKKQLQSAESLDLYGMIPGIYLLEIYTECKKEIHPLIISDPG